MGFRLDILTPVGGKIGIRTRGIGVGTLVRDSEIELLARSGGRRLRMERLQWLVGLRCDCSSSAWRRPRLELSNIRVDDLLLPFLDHTESER